MTKIQGYIKSVIQIYVEGIIGSEIKSILNPRIGDLQEWTGSGFFVDTKFGSDIIVTNAHVVKNARTIEIMSMLTSEERFEVEIVDFVENQEPDIAILKLKEGELERFISIATSEIHYLKLSSNNLYTRGTPLKAIGYPMGMNEPNITSGEVSNFISGDRATAEKYVTDAAINPGNSGGPSIDENGFVVGVNTSIIQDAENIGFITPASFIEIILNNIYDKKTNSFSDIGGDFQRNSLILSNYLGMKENHGVIITHIDKNGFLDRIGAKKHDVLIAINGNQFDRHGICMDVNGFHRKNLFDLFKLIPISENVSIDIFRDGKMIKLQGQATPKIEKAVHSVSIVNDRKFIEIWGLTIQKLSFEIIESLVVENPEAFYEILKHLESDKEIAIVTHIKKGSTAYLQEWSLGEVILKVNGNEISNMKHLKSILEDEGNENFIIESLFGSLGYFTKKDKDSKLLNLTPEDFLN